MTTAIRVELAIAVVAWLVFLALSWGMWRTRAGQQLVLAAVVALGEAASLLSLSLGLRVPVWLFAVGFALGDLVVLRWVWLRWRARRDVA